MSIATGIISAPIKLVKGVGNRYRIAIHENKIDDQISPEEGISGWVFDKVEDTTNFLTLGAVARVKNGIKTKGYGELSGEEIDSNLIEQYSQITSEAAEKAKLRASKAQELYDNSISDATSEEITLSDRIY